MANATGEPETWGRVLIAGGTNWATNGRKDRPATRDTDLLEPHIIRSLCNVRVQKIITGPTANYAVVIDTRGVARIFGRSPALGLAVNTVGVISEHAPLRVTPWSLGAPKGTKFVGGAAGRSHLLLVDSEGSVWTCGNNVVGQCGLPTCFEIEDFTRVTGGWPKGTKIVQVSAGNTFSLFLTEGGEIYAAGSSESGQLGNGKTGERLLKGGKIGYDVEVPPKLVQGLAGKKIAQIASGNQHSLAMDEDGYVWAWGFAGYSRLGLQDQKDRLVPTLVPTFAGGNEATRASMILCGPTNSVVIDRLKMYHMAGKFKLTGDGSTGQPYTSFKLIQEVTSCKVIRASCGGCTHFLTTTGSDGSVMTVGFGQGALYGELALGPDAGKSATKPQEVEPLRGVDVIDIAAGAFFTLFLARPNDTMSNLYRFPQSVPSEPACLVCHRDDELGLLLECEKCDQPYHTKCLDPPLPSVPEGEWFCPECMQEAADEEKEDDEVSIPSRRDTSVVDSVKSQAKSDRARTKSSTPRTKRLHSEDAGSDRGAKKKR